MPSEPVQPLPQPPPAQPPPPTYTYPPITVILTIILLIFFFVGFFSIYFCRCFMQNILVTWHLRHSPVGTPAGGPNSSGIACSGLDSSIVESFPTFTYSTVKDYRKEKYGLECAICLVEFDGSDVLRLLTVCYHVFHQECIDLWLESHKTCPFCRRNLESPMQSPLKSPAGNVSMHHIDENEPIENSVTITINNDEDEDERKATSEKDQKASREQGDRDQIDKFSRSHSTGHSIVRNRQEGEKEGKEEEREDRYTLRLPEDVKARIIKGHNSSKSWSTFGEYNKAKANTRSTGLGEASGVSAGHGDLNNV